MNPTVLMNNTQELTHSDGENNDSNKKLKQLTYTSLSPLVLLYRSQFI